MRGAFGLVALMIVAFIVIWLWSTHTAVVSEQYKQMKPKVDQLSGHDTDGSGRKAGDTYTLDPVESGGKMRGMKVASLVSGGAMETYFGFQVGDVVTAVGPLDMRDYDRGMGKALIDEAYQRQQELTVIRNGQTIKLPQDRAVGRTGRAGGRAAAIVGRLGPSAATGRDRRAAGGDAVMSAAVL